jgi:pilus assembly protein CpaE
MGGNRIGCLLVEAEPESLKRAESVVRASGSLDLRGKFPSLDAAVDTIRNLRPEIVLVDLDSPPAPPFAGISAATKEFPFLFVVAMSGRSDADLILRAMRAGAHEFLGKPLKETDFAAAIQKIAKLRNRKEPAAETGRVLTIFSSKGGNGATTIGANLADAIVRNHGKRVVVVDLALARGDVSVLFNVNPAYSILDLARNAGATDYDFLDSLLVKHRSGVSILAEPPSIEDAELILASQVREALGILRATFDFVIVDTPHQYDERTLTALEMSDSILLVSVLDLPSLRNAQRCLDLFGRLRLRDDGRVKLVLNRYLPDGEIDGGKVEGLLGQPVFFTIPNDYPAVIASVNRGRLLSEVAPESEVTVAFRRMADRIAGADLPPAADSLPPQKKPGILGRFFRKDGAP